MDDRADGFEKEFNMLVGATDLSTRRGTLSVKFKIMQWRVLGEKEITAERGQIFKLKDSASAGEFSLMDFLSERSYLSCMIASTQSPGHS